ncbi:MAG: hypothetical protein GKR90_27530 [Pseudomonadales bacterium]|nr:hypothetical protein [Pseudomonadales bacterium]
MTFEDLTLLVMGLTSNVMLLVGYLMLLRNRTPSARFSLITVCVGSIATLVTLWYYGEDNVVSRIFFMLPFVALIFVVQATARSKRA